MVLGGAKVSDKLGVIDNLLGTADRLLVGGGMVFTFLAAQGHEVGKSLLEADQIDTVRGLPGAGRGRRRRASCCPSTSSRRRRSRPTPTTRSSRPTRSRPTGWGSTSARRRPHLFAAKLADAATVFWNGPMGVFEMAPFADGTRALAQALIESDGLHRRRRRRLGGRGAHSSASPRRRSATSRTGGGASLEYLEGKTLPGLTVLED